MTLHTPIEISESCDHMAEDCECTDYLYCEACRLLAIATAQREAEAHGYAEGLRKAAQGVRYYLKHQNLPGWSEMSPGERGTHVACVNTEKKILSLLSTTPSDDSEVK